jgi:pimeloyl-ACP methyl ester carboxylesterase
MNVARRTTIALTLADEFHLVAPDYPGFGNSSMPSVREFDYTSGSSDSETD